MRWSPQLEGKAPGSPLVGAMLPLGEGGRQCGHCVSGVRVLRLAGRHAGTRFFGFEHVLQLSMASGVGVATRGQVAAMTQRAGKGTQSASACCRNRAACRPLLRSWLLFCFANTLERKELVSLGA